MSQLDLAYEMAKIDLSAPRVLLQQVVDYIREHYGYVGEALPAFFTEKFASLEDYELDLCFSPQFTPAEHNRLEYIPVLADGALSSSDVSLLKRRLCDANLQTNVKALDAPTEISLPVHEVFVDRYINLLKLDSKLPEGLYQEILTQVPEVSRNEANLLAREQDWQNPMRRDILAAFLRIFKARGNFAVAKVAFLTHFVRTYRPGSLLDMDRQLEALVESCKHDMENISGRGFADENLKTIYAVDGGVNRSGTSDDGVWHHYRQMMEMAQQLQEDYRHVEEAAPDLLERARQQQPV
jgi:hypothetical protein